jgi:thiosulfate/3-mercaptopyruvate sulfurtransferase
MVGLIDRQVLLESLGRGVQVLDARTHAEHLGEDLRSNARGGHLPGAKWLAHADLLNPDGTLKSQEELKTSMSAAGLDDDAPSVTHCDAGGRAALAALAAVVAGQRDVHAYYRSFSDCTADGACPVVKP